MSDFLNIDRFSSWKENSMNLTFELSTGEHLTLWVEEAPQVFLVIEIVHD